MGTLSVQPPWGATRSLTEIFILLRNNAVQSREMLDAGGVGAEDERESLVKVSLEESPRLAPEWVNMVDEVQYEMSRIRTRLKELREAEQKHLNRPSFNDDSAAEERAIQTATKEITKMMAHSKRLIAHINAAQGASKRPAQAQLKANVVSALVAELQKLTGQLRSSQGEYCRQLQSREDNFEQYFGASEEADLLGSFSPSPMGHQSSSSFHAGEAEAESLRVGLELDGGGGGAERSMAQLEALEASTSKVRKREAEILAVSKSIQELNVLFKDLAAFVVEQGTVMDRIDFNIEQSTLRVSAALKSVRKAHHYQAKNRKMQCILILSAAVICMLIAIIIKKSLTS